VYNWQELPVAAPADSNVIPAGKSDDRENLHLEDLLDLHHEGHLDSRLQGMVRDDRLGNLLPDIRHATKDRRKESARAAGRRVGMDRGMDKDRDKVVAVLVDNMDRDIQQRTEMKPNQVRMPCDQPPVFEWMISAYAITQSHDTLLNRQKIVKIRGIGCE